MRAGAVEAGSFAPRGSTAATTHGCLAEDYAPILADILHRWFSHEVRYFSAHPMDVTDADRLRLDVAESFCRAVASASPSSSVSAPPAADTDRPAVPEGQGKATTAPRANQGGAA